LRLLNQQSDKAFGRNTALHIAAGNVNVTREFIHQLKMSNAKIQNAAGDTPFHVAARSTNPKAREKQLEMRAACSPPGIAVSPHSVQQRNKIMYSTQCYSSAAHYSNLPQFTVISNWVCFINIC